MEKKTERKNKIYRITIDEDSTHRRIKAYRFSTLGLMVTVVTIPVVIILLVYCAFAFTPLRTTIPGYPDAKSKKQAVENAIRIDSLENVIIRWELYSENLSRVLSGDKTISLDSLIDGNTTKFLKNISEEEMQRQDSLLRSKFADETR